MSHVRILSQLLAITFSLVIASDSFAQRFQPFGPLDFDHDFQIFAPAEISSYGGGPDANEGYFFTYDRLNMAAGRPRAALQPNEFDWTWGNRVEFGFMTDDNHGWMAELIHVDGPNVHSIPTTRLPQAPVGAPPNQPAPGLGLNQPPGPAQNVMDLTSFELMKQWRLKPLHHGSIVELFAGAKFSRLNHIDNVRFTRAPRAYPRSFPNTVPPGTNLPVIPGNPPGATLGRAAENEMIGPQIGLRWFKQKGPWTLSTEGRYHVAYNNQYIVFNRPRGLVFPNPNPPPVNLPSPPNVPTQGSLFPPFAINRGFWLGSGDIRGEVTYDVTKSFALSAGCQAIYFANGIARGLPPGGNNQGQLLWGFSFGASINR